MRSTPHTLRLAGLIAASALATLLAMTAMPAVAASDDPTTDRALLGAGQHVDAVYAVIENDELEIKTMTLDGEVDPDAVILHIPETDSSRINLPEGYEFLGDKGEDAWVSTQVQDESVVWPGWSAESIPSSGTLTGTVKMEYTGFSYAGEADNPSFAITQPGGLSKEKVNTVIAPGTAFTSTSVEPGAHVHGNWLFSAKGAYDIDFTVSAKLVDGTLVSDHATVRFLVGEPDDADTPFEPQSDAPATASSEGVALTPNYVDAEYFTGQSIAVTATMSPEPEGATVQWFTKKVGDEQFIRDETQKAEVFATKPIRALDRSQVVAKFVGADGTVIDESEPLEIRVAANPINARISVEPDAESYAVGDTATFQSTQTTDEFTHYHWYIKLAGDDSYEWIPETRAVDMELVITDEMDGAQVVGRLFTDDHASVTDSDPVVLDVTDAEPAVSGEPIEITRTTPGDPITVNEIVEYTAGGVSEGSSVEWMVRHHGENPFVPIEGAQSESLELTAAEGLNGAEIVARTLSADGTVTQESTNPTMLWIENVSPTSADAEKSDELPSLLVWILLPLALALVAATALVLYRRRVVSQRL